MPVKKDQESNESFVGASFIECKKVKITRLTGTVQYMLRTALRPQSHSNKHETQQRKKQLSLRGYETNPVHMTSFPSTVRQNTAFNTNSRKKLKKFNSWVITAAVAVVCTSNSASPQCLLTAAFPGPISLVL